MIKKFVFFILIMLFVLIYTEAFASTPISVFNFNLDELPAPVSGDAITSNVLYITDLNNGDIPSSEYQLLESCWARHMGGDMYKKVSGEFMYGVDYSYVLTYAFTDREEYYFSYFDINLTNDNIEIYPYDDEMRPMKEVGNTTNAAFQIIIDFEFEYTDYIRVAFEANGGSFINELDSDEAIRVIERHEEIENMPECPTPPSAEYMFMGWAEDPDATYVLNGGNPTYFTGRKYRTCKRYYAIYRKMVDAPYIDWNTQPILRFNGQPQYPIISNFSGDLDGQYDYFEIYYSPDPVYPSDWPYTIRFDIKYDEYVWNFSDRQFVFGVDDIADWQDTVELEFNIYNGIVHRPELAKDEFGNPITQYTYTGEEVHPNIVYFDSGEIDHINGSSDLFGYEVREYYAEFSPAQYYEWDSGEELQEYVRLDWEIVPAHMDNLILTKPYVPVIDSYPITEALVLDEGLHRQVYPQLDDWQVETQEGFEHFSDQFVSGETYKVIIRLDGNRNIYFDENSQITLEDDRCPYTTVITKSPSEETIWYAELTFTGEYPVPTTIPKPVLLRSAYEASEYDTYPLLDYYDNQMFRIEKSAMYWNNRIDGQAILRIYDYYAYNTHFEDGTTVVYYTYKLGRKGDVDYNNTKDLIDVRIMLQTILNPGAASWQEIDKVLMDMNYDDEIDILDVRLALQNLINP